MFDAGMAAVAGGIAGYFHTGTFFGAVVGCVAAFAVYEAVNFFDRWVFKEKK